MTRDDNGDERDKEDDDDGSNLSTIGKSFIMNGKRFRMKWTFRPFQLADGS